MQNQFNIADSIICINNDETGISKFLTVGKVYKIIKIEIFFDKIFLFLINDKNIIESYYHSRFLSVKEQRKLKLNKLTKMEYQKNWKRGDKIVCVDNNITINSTNILYINNEYTVVKVEQITDEYYVTVLVDNEERTFFLKRFDCKKTQRLKKLKKIYARNFRNI